MSDSYFRFPLKQIMSQLVFHVPVVRRIHPAVSAISNAERGGW